MSRRSTDPEAVEDQPPPSSELSPPQSDGSDPIEDGIHHPTSSPIVSKSPAKVHKVGSRVYGKPSFVKRLAAKRDLSDSSDSDSETADEINVTPVKKASKPLKRVSNASTKAKTILKSGTQKSSGPTVQQSNVPTKSRSNSKKQEQEDLSLSAEPVENDARATKNKAEATGRKSQAKIDSPIGEQSGQLDQSKAQPVTRRSGRASNVSESASVPVKKGRAPRKSKAASSETEQDEPEAKSGQTKPVKDAIVSQPELAKAARPVRTSGRKSAITKPVPPAAEEAPTSPLTERSPTVISSSGDSSPEIDIPLTTSLALDQAQAATSSAPTTALMSASARIPAAQSPLRESSPLSMQSPAAMDDVAMSTPTPLTPTRPAVKRRRSSPVVTKAVKKAKVIQASKSFPSLASPVAGPSRLPMPIDSDSDMDDLPKASQPLERTPLKKREANRWLSRSPTPLPWHQTPEKSAREKENEFKVTELPAGVQIGDSIYIRNRQGQAFWPAVLEGFEPVQSYADSKNKRMTDLYLIMEYGKRGKMAKKRRTDVIFMQDEQIADCKLGILEMDLSRPKKSSTQEQIDDDDENETPVTPEEFNDLSFAKQLRRIRPHLTRVLEELYAPAQWRIDMFFAGVRSRKALNGFAPFGDISENEIEGQVIPPLRQWFLHDSSTEETTFSERIKELSDSMKEELLNKVLVPEALLQLCIRSMGLVEDQAWLQRGLDESIDDSVAKPIDDESAVEANPTRQPFAIPIGLDEEATFQYKLYNQAYKTLIELTAQGDSWTRVLEELREARRMMRVLKKMPAENGGDAEQEEEEHGVGRRRRKAKNFSDFEKH